MGQGGSTHRYEAPAIQRRADVKGILGDTHNGSYEGGGFCDKK